jgi:hypothetical protein
MNSGMATRAKRFTPSIMRCGRTMEGIGGANRSKLMKVAVMMARKIGAARTSNPNAMREKMTAGIAQPSFFSGGVTRSTAAASASASAALGSGRSVFVIARMTISMPAIVDKDAPMAAGRKKR